MKNTNNELIKSEVESVTGRDMNNSNIYLSECDSNGVPLLKRIEKYPDLPEDEFIFLNILDIKKDTYRINKRGEIINNKTGKLLNSINRYGYISQTLISNSGKKLHFRVHRVIAEFILKRDLEKDEVVDHINTVRHDNSFSNLRVTDMKGNMNNQKTLEKLIKCFVVSDLCGDFLNYTSSKEFYRIFLKKEVNKSKRDSILLVNIVNQKYICIEAGDKDALYKKMENVIYIFNKSKTKILGAYSSIYSTGNNLHNDNKTILKYINTDHDINGMYYMRGPEAVKLVLLLGHGTAGDYKPEE